MADERLIRFGFGMTLDEHQKLLQLMQMLGIRRRQEAVLYAVRRCYEAERVRAGSCARAAGVGRAIGRSGN